MCKYQVLILFSSLIHAFWHVVFPPRHLPVNVFFFFVARHSWYSVESISILGYPQFKTVHHILNVAQQNALRNGVYKLNCIELMHFFFFIAVVVTIHIQRAT